ncbi:hypothetical protein BJY04DRAFT_225246 [Aspergillus karnatakaensis]|uniref:uncharacterized protein n=1 Tax=Aspergillus karnatakaensis TaxID=1810916 RepID=UPI003CCD76EA
MWVTARHFFFTLSCLAAFGVGDAKNLFRSRESHDESLALIPNNASAVVAADLFATDFLLKRQGTCPSGSGLCPNSGRCCRTPADACCSDGACIQRSKHTCCVGGKVCLAEQQCCEIGCAPPSSQCCTGSFADHHCNPGYKCCEDMSAPVEAQCCQGGGFCNAGETCVLSAGGVRGCCPESGCYEASRTIYWYWYEYWYTEVCGGVRSGVGMSTSTLELTSSVQWASSRVTVTAENSVAASCLFRDLSRSRAAVAVTSTSRRVISTPSTTVGSSTIRRMGSSSTPARTPTYSLRLTDQPDAQPTTSSPLAGGNSTYFTGGSCLSISAHRSLVYHSIAAFLSVAILALYST